MRRPDSPESLAELARFLRRSVERGEKGTCTIRPLGSVTALIYFFWDAAMAESRWPEFEGALLETWRQCGLLKTVIVTNEAHRCVCDFADRFLNVELQVEPRIRAGNINDMSFDCNGRLHERFSTDYVLVVQNDGFPLRPGLEKFVRMGYDFYGAPHCRPALVPSLLTRLLRFCPSNGGFSLRSRRICRLASELWKHGGFESRPFIEDIMAEDYFYTKTLPKSGFVNWIRRSQAPSSVSDVFSYGATFPLTARVLPFGFHTATAFAALLNRFMNGLRD